MNIKLHTILFVTCLFTTPFAAYLCHGQGYPSFEQMLQDPDPQLPSVQALTTGPKAHCFSYYDILEFDPSQRYLLAAEVDFDKRSPTPRDTIQIGMIDLQDNKRWIELGESCAFEWQLGCRLQWRPGSATEVLWNDREEDHFICRILDVETKKMRTLPYPVFHISPDGVYALGLDFARLNDMDPGYGYPGSDPYADQIAPGESGIYKINLNTGEYEYLISLAQIANLRFGEKAIPGKTYFNHIAWNPDGSRFLFLSRGHGMPTKGYTAAADGSDIRPLEGDLSHYTWRDPKTLLIWRNRAYHLYDVETGENKTAWEALNGHQTYLNNKDWIITDTYPLEGRIQHLHLVHLPTKTFIPLGRFFSPEDYKPIEWRCDLHPRVSPDGTKIVFESTHTSQGRQIYMIDISKLIQSPPYSKPESSLKTISLPGWVRPDSTINRSFTLGGSSTQYKVWGSDVFQRYYPAEFLPAVFERTLQLNTALIPEQKLLWIFSGERSGFTVGIDNNKITVVKRYYDSPGFARIGSKARNHPEWQDSTAIIPYTGKLNAVTVRVDHMFNFSILLNGKNVLTSECWLDVTRHQIHLTGNENRIDAELLEPEPRAVTIKVNPGQTFQEMTGFGGIGTPTAYKQFSEEGKLKWWNYICEYNLLIQRENPVAQRLNPQMDNWDKLEDANPHYYGNNFPNGEVSNFNYNRIIKHLGGIIWFELWDLPPWAGTDTEEYARAMLAYCQTSRERAGFPPDVCGIQNEKDQSAEMYQSMTLALRRELDKEGFNDVRIHMANAPYLSQGIKRVSKFRSHPNVWQHIDYSAVNMYDYQNYFQNPDDFDTLLIQWRELTSDKPFLSTEISVHEARYQYPSYRLALSMGQLYHKNLVLADAISLAYCWTILNILEPSYGWTRSLFVVDPWHGFVPKPSSNQLRVFGSYSRRVHKGMIRIATNSADSDLLTCAFAGADNSATLIALNRSCVPKTITIDWPDATFTEMETTSLYHENSVQLIRQTVNKPLTIPIDPGTIITLTNVPLKSLPDEVKELIFNLSDNEREFKKHYTPVIF